MIPRDQGSGRVSGALSFRRRLSGRLRLFPFMVAILAGMEASAASAAETLARTAQAVDGRRLRLHGRVVALAGIAAPPPSAPCLWRDGRIRDCGRMARAGIADLLAGARVRCRLDARLGGWRCAADGYDLALGLIHAGWARPLPGAPAAWFVQQRRARRRRLMLWSARTTDGAPFMESLSTARAARP